MKKMRKGNEILTIDSKLVGHNSRVTVERTMKINKREFRVLI